MSTSYNKVLFRCKKFVLLNRMEPEISKPYSKHTISVKSLNPFHFVYMCLYMYVYCQYYRGLTRKKNQV